MKKAMFMLGGLLMLACTKTGNDPCVDPSAIDPNMMCTMIYDPVCGCDGNTYSNACVATYSYGVQSYVSGSCENSCLPLDFNYHNDTTYRDHLQIDTAYIEDDCLKVKFWHGGGCGEHDFRMSVVPMCYTPPVSPSYLVLEHRNNGDLCQAWLHKELSFQLSELHSDSGVVRFMLSDYQGNYQKQFTYNP